MRLPGYSLIIPEDLNWGIKCNCETPSVDSQTIIAGEIDSSGQAGYFGHLTSKLLSVF